MEGSALDGQRLLPLDETDSELTLPGHEEEEPDRGATTNAQAGAGAT